jgi:hypothetical protein
VAWDAITVWQGAGLDAAHVAALAALQIEVADLPGRELGLGMPGRVVLDVDAAGYGWLVDTTPRAQDDAVPDDRMDLLTVVLHELGHAIGLAHVAGEDDLMAEILQPGTRRLPTVAAVDEVLASGAWLD